MRRLRWPVHRVLSTGSRGKTPVRLTDHSSGPVLANGLKRRPERRARRRRDRASPPTSRASHSCLSPGGVCLPPSLDGGTGALTSRFHPCHARLAAPFGGAFSVALSVEGNADPRLPVRKRPAHWSSDFPPRPSSPRRSADHRKKERKRSISGPALRWPNRRPAGCGDGWTGRCGPRPLFQSGVPVL